MWESDDDRSPFAVDNSAQSAFQYRPSSLTVSMLLGTFFLIATFSTIRSTVMALNLFFQPYQRVHADRSGHGLYIYSSSTGNAPTFICHYVQVLETLKHTQIFLSILITKELLIL